MAFLDGHIVALEQNTFLVSYLGEHYPTIKILECPDVYTALRAVTQGDADAYIGNKLTTKYQITARAIQGLDIHGQSKETSETNVIAVRNDWPVLSSLLDRALSSISHKKLHTAWKPWLEASTAEVAHSEIGLTQDEVIWIQTHPEIVAGAETDWPPYDYVVNNKAAGFSNDYLRLLGEKAGLNIEFVHGVSWNELVEKAKRKEIDILPAILKSTERKEFLTFTDSYLDHTQALVVHQDAKEINSLDDLAGKSLARVKGYASNETIKEKYPDINFVFVTDTVAALMAVSEGVADGFLDYLAVSNYLRREHLIPNLRVANANAFDVILPLYIGVRKDWSVLRDILKKAMAVVSQDEYEELKERGLTMKRMAQQVFNSLPPKRSY
jgi:ABC-type amino acid transport substrate-binding protein